MADVKISLPHSFLQNTSSFTKLDREHLSISIFKSFYRLPIRFQFRLWLGHSETWTCFNWNHFIMFFHHVTLFIPGLSLYLALSTLPYSSTIFLVLVEEKAFPNRDAATPISQSSGGVFRLMCSASFPPPLWFAFRWEYLILISSEHKILPSLGSMMLLIGPLLF